MENNLRKLQLVDLEILIKIRDFCVANQITYYISGGTYLGAVRHQGFIPWDDDVDVAMPRDCYEKFIALFPESIEGSDIKLITYKNTEDSFYHYPIRVESNKVKMKYTGAVNDKIISAWVDVFPLDGMPSNAFRSKLHQFDLLAKRALFKLSCFDDVVNLGEGKRSKIDKIIIFFGKNVKVGRLFNPIKRLNAIDKALKRFSPDKSDVYVNFMGAYRFKSIISKEEVYGEGAFYDFEGYKLYGPENYDAYLTQIYGDYMRLPPDQERNKHQLEILK